MLKLALFMELIMDDGEIKSGTSETANFWELAGYPQHESLPGETPRQFLARINDPSKWLYGSPLRDEMLLKCESTLPRYAHLSRKAFIHYAGSHYNPHTIEFMQEYELRTFIKWWVEYKVQGKAKDYDWECVNDHLKNCVHNILNIPLPDDYVPHTAGIRPEFRSIYHGIEDTTPH